MSNAGKRILQFIIMISLCTTQNVFGGSMSSLPYSKIKNPERLFDISLNLYNRQNLNELIPSISAQFSQNTSLENQKIGLEGIVSNKPEGLIAKVNTGDSYDDIMKLAKQGLDGSQEKYIFGTIKYKNEIDYRVDTTVNLTIYSPNNPNLSVNDVVIRGVGIGEVYFLVYAGTPVMNTTDNDAILSYKIVEARAK